MIKGLNWLYFCGTLAKSCAVFLKSAVPDWQKLVRANKNEKFIDELEREAQVINQSQEKKEEVKP